MSDTDIRRWFFEERTAKEQMRLLKEYVPIPASYLEQADDTPCDFCDTTGECQECDGNGWVTHDCNCEWCEEVDDCEECGNSGDCYPCNGTGYEDDTKRI